ncbi:MAG: hypothetical protein R3B45_15460 [Bdellovibrionota bacterium]
MNLRKLYIKTAGLLVAMIGLYGFTNNKSKNIPLEIGGSNYPMYDVSGYLNAPDPSGAWFDEGNLKLVIGDFHQDPDAVKNQLKTMYQNGQRKIALILWHTHFPQQNTDNTFGNIVRSNEYKLPDQQESNLENILNEINAIGYDEVFLRFAPQRSANPGNWNGWDKTQFAENWNFILNTVNKMEETLDASIRRAYDLGLELGGIDTGYTSQYIIKLWEKFKINFPALPAGFSIAYSARRLDKLIRILKTTDFLPSEYWINIYGSSTDSLGPTAAIRHVKQELNQNGEGHKQIAILETYYNDQKQYQEIIDAVSKHGLKLRFIMQWPFNRNAKISHFSVNYPANYQNYLQP